MTVSELRNNLKGLSGDMPIYISDHDHGTYETNGNLRSANVVDHADMSDEDIRRHKYNGFEIMKGKYLSLRVG